MTSLALNNSTVFQLRADVFFFTGHSQRREETTFCFFTFVGGWTVFREATLQPTGPSGLHFSAVGNTTVYFLFPFKTVNCLKIILIIYSLIKMSEAADLFPKLLNLCRQGSGFYQLFPQSLCRNDNCTKQNCSFKCESSILIFFPAPF